MGTAKASARRHPAHDPPERQSDGNKEGQFTTKDFWGGLQMSALTGSLDYPQGRSQQTNLEVSRSDFDFPGLVPKRNQIL